LSPPFQIGHTGLMPRFKFTPELLAEIQHRIAVGQTAREVASRLGCDYNSMRAVCNRHVISLRPPDMKGGRTMDPMRSPPKSIELKLPVEVFARLRIEARKRGISTTELSAAILGAVVCDGLVVAVLDDGR
jgi:hypothetical protein